MSDESGKVKVNIDRGVSGLTLLILAFWGKPDLWDAIIFWLMKGTP